MTNFQHFPFVLESDSLWDYAGRMRIEPQEFRYLLKAKSLILNKCGDSSDESYECFKHFL